MILSELN